MAKRSEQCCAACKPDAPTTKFILFTFFKANFPELNAIVCDDPSKPVPEPDAKCQRTDECPAEVEEKELEGDEADDDSNFDDVDTKEFDQQFLSPEDAAALDTVRPLIAEAAMEDSKMVMALAFPFAFPVPVLAKAVDMTSVPEGAAAHSLPQTPQTPLVKVLMTKWDSFKGLAKLAAVTYKSIAASQFLQRDLGNLQSVGRRWRARCRTHFGVLGSLQREKEVRDTEESRQVAGGVG